LHKYLPKGLRLEQLIIVYRDKDFITVLSKVMEHQLNSCAKQTTIELESLKFDSSLEGLERVPGEFFAKAKSESSVWPKIKHKFKCVDYKIPPLKSLEVYQEKVGVHIELHNPNDKFEFLILDKESGASTRLITKFMYGSDKHAEAKFLVQFLVFE